MDAFYKFEKLKTQTIKDYCRYRVVECKTSLPLTGTFLRSHQETTVISGSVGLLKSDKHPGYCQLFFTYRNTACDGNVTITFTPAYTQDGNLIFIKTDTECPFCLIEVSRSKDYYDKCCVISFIK